MLMAAILGIAMDMMSQYHLYTALFGFLDPGKHTSRHKKYDSMTSSKQLPANVRFCAIRWRPSWIFQTQ